MRAQADGMVYGDTGGSVYEPVLCKQHGYLFCGYDATCTLNGEPCECQSADEEKGEVWVYATDEDLKSISVYDAVHGEDYELTAGVIRIVSGAPYFVLKRLRGDVKLHLTCPVCFDAKRVAA